MTPGVSTMSITIESPFAFEMVTSSFRRARRVSWGISETGPSASPVQSRTIRFASVVLPAFGGP